jgi:pyrimidine operon attenuation protein/uracil phosphoribosyltransferase
VNIVKKTVLNASEVSETILRMAEEILAEHSPPNNLVLVGILTGGAILAQRLKEVIKSRTGVEVQTGVLDISLYRDDWTRLGPKPIVRRTEINFSIDDKRVILVDDVLFTGRTVRAAMDALTDFGRPSRIELAVLADRGHRELPICTNFAGLQLDTDLDERVNVYFSDLGQDDEVAVESTG